MPKRILFSGLLLMFMCAAGVNAQTRTTEISATTPSSQFTPHNDGTVTDNATGLMWKVCSEGQTWVSGSGCSGSPIKYVWQQALAQGQAVGVAGYAGYNDWRVPNIKELNSIVELACSGPAINLQIFPATPAYYFWSASPYAARPGNVWDVVFTSGYDGANGKSDGGYARLVRGGQ